MDFLAPSTHVETAPAWKILVVDDEPEVHDVTRLVLQGFTFENRPLQFLAAHSAQQARELLAANPDIAVILLDVVMETDQAGLELVKHIRNTLGNHFSRIVLRTGQPGQAPEHDVITNYDINDYKEKTELTAQKLSTMMFAALRGYRDIMTIEANKRGLERVIAASADIFSHEQPMEFASAVLSQLTALVGMERGALYIRVAPEQATSAEQLVVSAATGEYARYVDHAVGEGLPQHMLDTLRAAFANKQHQFRDNHYVLHFTDSQQSESLLYVGENWDLSPLDYKLVEVFCTNVSIAFENLHLHQELVEAQMEMIHLLAGAAESRSQETAAHVRRVGLLAEVLARAAGMDPAESERLRYAAPLHDIGKIGIPDSVLNKPGAHTEEETRIMRTHAEIGHRMLSGSKRGVLRLAAEVAISHHENWDGSGYPRGIAGETIPLSGRITALADVFDALGSRRCYKEPWPEPRIREFISGQSGVKFDPGLVELLFAHWDEVQAIRARLPD
jgi:response regulator RpfG family c-di-GMP phosphodiesterase